MNTINKSIEPVPEPEDDKIVSQPSSTSMELVPEPEDVEDSSYSVDDFEYDVHNYILDLKEAGFKTTNVRKMKVAKEYFCYVYIINNASLGKSYVLKMFLKEDEYNAELSMTRLFMDESEKECASYFNMMLKDDVPGITSHNKPRFTIIMTYFPKLMGITVDNQELYILNINVIKDLITINKILYIYYRGVLTNFIKCLRELNKKHLFHRDLKYDNIVFVKMSKSMQPRGVARDKLWLEPYREYSDDREKEIEKGLHLIDYGSAIKLETNFTLNDFVSGTTARNLFPLYIFLGKFGVGGKKPIKHILIYYKHMRYGPLF